MSFNDISIFSSGGHVGQHSEIRFTVPVEGY